MHSLGNTRSRFQRDHLLHTPDTFIRIPLPAIADGVAVVHCSPACGAGFTWYTAELEVGGTLAPTANQRFVYVLEGAVRIGADELISDSYAYLPEGSQATLTAGAPSRIAVMEKVYEQHPGLDAPAAFFGHEDAAVATPLLGDPDLVVRALLPDSPAYDFAVNTMTYQPGAALSQVELHVMEHGLLMLEGGGVYRLGGDWYPVEAGDFIWMAPYCPQWFGALGKVPAKYLIYKDFNRHPLAD
jgi:(S)-ureidoglycine aminohydrolase